MLNAWFTLLWLSFRRMLWSTTTLMIAFPLLATALTLLRWHPASWLHFTDGFVKVMFLTILLPICALAFATTSLGSDREERTLVFLLTRPVPRWLILLAKLSAALPLVMGLTVGSFWVFCRLSGGFGRVALECYLPVVFYMTLAYVGMFQLFAVAFRHSTIVALIYALFFEPLVSNMPGIVNHASIRFYGWSFIERASGKSPAAWSGFYEPVSQGAAAATLAGIALGALLVAAVVFQRREYRDAS